MTAALEKTTAYGQRNCSVCSNAAGWTLTRDGKTWELCASHAARASHTYGIVNRVFNPEGKKS
jgi:hypothetical protein